MAPDTDKNALEAATYRQELVGRGEHTRAAQAAADYFEQLLDDGVLPEDARKSADERLRQSHNKMKARGTSSHSLEHLGGDYSELAKGVYADLINAMVPPEGVKAILETFKGILAAAEREPLKNTARFRPPSHVPALLSKSFLRLCRHGVPPKDAAALFHAAGLAMPKKMRDADQERIDARKKERADRAKFEMVAPSNVSAWVLSRSQDLHATTQMARFLAFVDAASPEYPRLRAGGAENLLDDLRGTIAKAITLARIASARGKDVARAQRRVATLGEGIKEAIGVLTARILECDAGDIALAVGGGPGMPGRLDAKKIWDLNMEADACITTACVKVDEAAEALLGLMIDRLGSSPKEPTAHNVKRWAPVFIEVLATDFWATHFEGRYEDSSKFEEFIRGAYSLARGEEREWIVNTQIAKLRGGA